MMDSLPTLKPIESEAELAYIAREAATDNHCVFYATHIAKLAGQILGYASIFAAPLVVVWTHSAKTSAKTSVLLLSILENVLRCLGRKEYIMSCSKNSPYFEYMEKLGFENIGEAVFFRKRLKD